VTFYLVMKKVLANGSLNDQEVFPPNIHINIVYEYELYIGKNPADLPNLWRLMDKRIRSIPGKIKTGNVGRNASDVYIWL